MNKKSFIPFSIPSIGQEEITQVSKALRSGWITLGPKTKEFENQVANYLGCKYAVGVSSCTAGLHIALLSHGIKQGDEVITSVFTFAATVNAIIHTGAKPVLVDIENDTYAIDPKKIEEKITSNTKAIIPVHYGGYPCDLEQIYKLAKKYKLVVIEDAAHAIGTRYKDCFIGSYGTTVFSFHPIKNITTGDGGMVTTNDELIKKQLELYRLHGMDKEAWKRFTKAGSWKYDILLSGYKYNMTDIEASIGIPQLKKLEGFIKTRTKIVALYYKLLNDVLEISFPKYTYDKGIRHSWNILTIQVDTSKLKVSRDELVDILKEKGIGTSVYFMPLHLFSYYKNRFGWKKGMFPVAEKLFDFILSLPLYPQLTTTDVAYICKTLSETIKNNKKHGK